MTDDTNTVNEYLRAHHIRAVLDAFVVDYTRQLHAQRQYLIQAQRYSSPTAAPAHDSISENDRSESTTVASPVTALRTFLEQHRDATRAAAAAQTYALILVEDDVEGDGEGNGETPAVPHSAMHAAQKLAERVAVQTSGRVLRPPCLPCSSSSFPSPDAGRAAATQAHSAGPTAYNNTTTTDELSEHATAAAGPSWAYEQEDVQSRYVSRTRAFMAASLRAQSQATAPPPPASPGAHSGPVILVGTFSSFPKSIGDAMALEQAFGEKPQAVLVLQKAVSTAEDAAATATLGSTPPHQRQSQRLASGACAPGWMQDLARPQQLLVLSRELDVQQRLLLAGAGSATAGHDAASRQETAEALESLAEAKVKAVLHLYECQKCLQVVSAAEWDDQTYMEALTGGFISALRRQAA